TLSGVRLHLARLGPRRRRVPVGGRGADAPGGRRPVGQRGEAVPDPDSGRAGRVVGPPGTGRGGSGRPGRGPGRGPQRGGTLLGSRAVRPAGGSVARQRRVARTERPGKLLPSGLGRGPPAGGAGAGAAGGGKPGPPVPPAGPPGRGPVAPGREVR